MLPHRPAAMALKARYNAFLAAVRYALVGNRLASTVTPSPATFFLPRARRCTILAPADVAW